MSFLGLYCILLLSMISQGPAENIADTSTEPAVDATHIPPSTPSTDDDPPESVPRTGNTIEIVPDASETVEDTRKTDIHHSTMIDSFTKAIWQSWQVSKEAIRHVIQELNDVDSLSPSNVTIKPAKNETSDVEAPKNRTTKAKQIICVPKNVTSNESSVMLVNSTMLHQRLSNRENVTGYCAVVMFYASWCLFCARAAPHYNAVGRAFPQMDVLAIDAVHFSSWNVRYGTIAVPNIIVFYNGRQVSRFNGTERTLPHIMQFVTNVTGFTPLENITVTEMDYAGPIPTEPTQTTDYYLIMAWAFVVISLLTVSLKSNRFQQMYTRIQALWQEHQHLD